MTRPAQHLRTLVAGAAAVLSITSGATAATPAPANGPIYFAGSRTENFYPEIYSANADGSGRHDLTNNPAPDSSFAVSPDRTKIAFLSSRDGYSAIYVMNADGSHQTRVCTPTTSSPDATCVNRAPRPGYELGTPVWSPTGGMLAFVGNRPAQDRTFDTFAVDLATHQVRALGRHERGLSPTFSPDGRLVAHGRLISRASSGAVVGRVPQWALANNLDPFGRRWAPPKVPNDNAVTEYDGSAPSPNGREIAFWVSRSLALNGNGVNASLYLTDFRSAHRYKTLITVSGDVQTDVAAWSPNGVWIAFSVDAGSARHTFLVRADGRGHGRASITLDDVGPTPVWSHDSRHLAILDDLKGVVVDVTPPSTASTTVTSSVLDQTVYQVAWAGNHLLFTSQAPGWDPTPADVAGSSRLLAIGPDGSDVPVPTGAPLGRISPDGTHVAFLRDSLLWTARVDGTDEHQLSDDAVSPGTEPAWSSDSRRIAFVCCGAKLFVVAASGRAARLVTALAPPIVQLGTPSWSPDGSRIAYVSLENAAATAFKLPGYPRQLGMLHLVQADGTNDHVLALPSGIGAAEPAWSPDGSRMVFATCSGLGVVNADGTGFHMLTNAPPCATGLVDTTPFLDTTPCWSPDGTKIVFARIVPVFFGLDLHIEYPELWARKSAPPTNLWSINADGTGQTRLTDVPSYDTDPIWLPAR